MQSWGCLRNSIQYIDRLINAQTSQQVLENKLRLKTSIIAIKCFAKQACAFRIHNESVNSKNQGNFIELIKHSAECRYDSASNMRGAWNGLQALFLKDCPYAYYIHCFAHQLQLALVAASNDVPDVWLFFSTLEVQTCTGANQIHTLQRPGATRWSSHFRSVSRSLDLFSVVRKVLGKLVEFLGIGDLLCQALQVKSQDILNVVHLVSTTKKLLQRLRDNGWETFIKNVVLFCEKNEIDMPDLKARHMKGRGRSCQQNDYITVEHYYHYDIFNIYFLLDRLIRLVLILPVSTATTERAFSAMKLIKTTHQNKMENEFLSYCMVIYIEREIADNIDSDAIIDKFSFLKNRRTQLHR
ncbi:hypothetical protein CISIN_1g039693mg [Citrus sinensis]|uniref:HAT C-terminal dimerisation domain-containing protein n=1 Tax=Citrus sinensis TaxID=2711 RepID=A0A067FK94_CITSI|nr:hypothetical protein CISIN_1g039693mg [Citrus sinensis]